ncbi:MAG: DUF2844 domain-containing protein [Nitrospiria bacterium]
MIIINHHNWKSLTIGLFLATTVAGLPSLAFAVLGEPKESVESDRQKMSGLRETIVLPQYSVEIINASGLTVHEYVAQDGTIFAVTWKGNKFPDLASLFGSYFNEFQQALSDSKKSGPRRRGSLNLKSANIVVNSGGHQPNLWGRAYLPSLLPAGVTEEQVQ